ncbi:MAG TPA: regulatory protein RecX [Gammaproteobacteria bacterium]|nr:regulatory protein RecX [Gammaproteobacteria bacterium]
MSLTKPRKPDPEQARDPARVRAKALSLLARREHSAGELRRKLLERGYDSTAVEAVLSSLEQQKLLSDGRFVEEFVAARVRRGSGPMKIREELRGKGVDAALVDQAVAAHQESWAAGAAAARRKRFGAALPKDMQERARQARFLQQRGFTMEDIRVALKGDIEE